ncbi:hypothetical protein [uncultured Desulfobacter sp.]|uniref:hypothetical protein n=1 Tax=uncultured Desulfobacter sp. TaxID=240139 RepID=UPI0029C66436|nr:hypothetical protein [uncultured Desulfobacter sp.]
MTENKQKCIEFYRATVDLVKAMIWPAVLLFIFLYIKDPIVSSLNHLPEIIKSSQKMTVGTVSIERKLEEAGIPEDVRNALARLSRGTFMFFLKSGATWHYLSENGESTGDAKYLLDLKEEKLITIDKTDHSQFPFKYTPTPYAKSAYEIVLHNVILQLGVSTAVSK